MVMDKTEPHYVVFAIAVKQVSVTKPHVQKWPKLQTKTHVDLINIQIIIPGWHRYVKIPVAVFFLSCNTPLKIKY